MKKKKSKKKLVIGVGILVVAVVAGVNIYGSMNAADSAIPQVKTVSAVRDNVQQTVEISGTVVSEEQKTYFSPVNAKVDTAALKEGETVKAGSSLIEFDQKDLEREAKKADLNVESGKLDMKNTLKKSDEAVRKQQNAAGDAASLKQQVAAQENYVAKQGFRRQMPMHRQHLPKLQQRNRQMQLPHRRHSSRKYSVNMHRHRLHIRMKPFLRIKIS